MRLSPPTCVDSLTPDDGGVGTDSDVTSDAPDGVDAPPPGACVADVDCGNGACHELDGTCVPEAEVLFAAPTGTVPAGVGTPCTRAAPCTIQGAIDARTPTRYTVALAPGTYPSSFDTVSMSGAVTKLVVSGPTRMWGDAVITSNSLNRVHVGLEAVFEGLTIRGANGSNDGINNRGTTLLSRVHIDVAIDDGVVSAEGSMTVADSQVTNGASTGIYASGGTLVVERTQVIGNDNYGIHIEGAAYTVVNSIIANNGTMLMQTAGVRILANNGGTSVFRFNTLARNQGITYPSILCDGAASFSNTIIGEASIIVPAVSPACSATYSLFNGSFGAPAGAGNIVGDPKFVSMTDFHLQAGSPAIDKANPSGAVPIDIDGQQRVAPPDIGADERL